MDQGNTLLKCLIEVRVLLGSVIKETNMPRFLIAYTCCELHGETTLCYVDAETDYKAEELAKGVAEVVENLIEEKK